jgi:hypothetical protein
MGGRRQQEQFLRESDMPANTDSMTLEQKVQHLLEQQEYLLDRQKILDCVCRYSRGLDRHDVEILRSAYHVDATDEHGFTVNSADDYPAWVNALHDKNYSLHLHNITTHNCEIDGATAHAESYVLYGLAHLNQKDVRFGGGRYIDRLEKRNGEWKIALRRTMVDWMFTGDAAAFYNEQFVKQGYPKGTHDKTDISYQRPLKLGAK